MTQLMTRQARPPQLVFISQPPAQLSALILRGRQFHRLSRGAFVKRLTWRQGGRLVRSELATCALAAAYAGAFGPDAVNDRFFSAAAAYAALSRLIGYDVGRLQLVNPADGHEQPIAEICISLVDSYGVNRRGVAAWLASCKL